MLFVASDSGCWPGPWFLFVCLFVCLFLSFVCYMVLICVDCFKKLLHHMVAAGRDLGSLLTQMKQKPPAMQQALDFHAESKLFLISNLMKINKDLLKTSKHPWD